MADMQAAQAEYMKQFQMQAVLEALVNETLEKEPSDPFMYMVGSWERSLGTVPAGMALVWYLGGQAFQKIRHEK